MSVSAIPIMMHPLVDPLTVSASNVTGNDSGFAACGSVSSSGDSPGTSASGGVPPYTYAWTQTGGAAEAGPFAISGATAQNPTWSDTRCASHTDNNENWEVEVTDDDGNTATDTISVTLVWTDLN